MISNNRHETQVNSIISFIIIANQQQQQQQQQQTKE